MNKLLIVLPILAILSIGAIVLLSHKKTQEETEGVEVPSHPTFTQWASCRQNAKQCDQMTEEQRGIDNVDFMACNLAAQQINSMYSYESAPKSSNCSTFQQIFVNGSEAKDVLPESYYNCVNDMTPVAQTSQFFFNNIFKPLYMTCAGI